MIIMERSEYMYDYYSYPPMYDNQDHNKLDYSNDDDDEGFQHVTYVNNGAVITSGKSNHFGSTVRSSFVDPDSDVPESVASDNVVEFSDKPEEDALVFLNPVLNGGSEPQFQSPVLDFDATLSGMMGALAEIQKKGDSMLGSIR